MLSQDIFVEFVRSVIPNIHVTLKFIELNWLSRQFTPYHNQGFLVWSRHFQHLILAIINLLTVTECLCKRWQRICSVIFFTFVIVLECHINLEIYTPYVVACAAGMLLHLNEKFIMWKFNHLSCRKVSFSIVTECLCKRWQRICSVIFFTFVICNLIGL
jgi:hypothetical protein